MTDYYGSSYRGGPRSRYNKSVGYPLKTYRTGRFFGGYNPGPPYVSSYRRFFGLRKYPQAGIETKYFDTSVAASAIPVPPATAAWTSMQQVPGTLLCLNCPTQGTGNTNRDGRFITMESLQINGIINIPPQADQTAADSMPIIKVWVILDKQTNGGVAVTGISSENVYTNPAATALGGMSPLRNMLYSKRYKVLREIDIEPKMLPITNDSAAMTSIEQEGVSTCFDCFINLKGLKVEYLGNAGTVADITTNGLFVCAATSSNSTAPTLTYNARLRFRG